VLFAGYRLLGFDPAAAHGAEHPYVAAQLMPALYALILMTASLRLVRRYRQEQRRPPHRERRPNQNQFRLNKCNSPVTDHP
jgi:hypothetical protein